LALGSSSSFSPAAEGRRREAGKARRRRVFTAGGNLRERAARVRLHGPIAHWSEVAGEPWLEQLFEIEASERSRRRLERRVLNAKIGPFEPLCDFDGSWPTKIGREAVAELFRFDFLEEAANVTYGTPAIHRPFTARSSVTAPSGCRLLEQVVNRCGSVPDQGQKVAVSASAPLNATPPASGSR